ncbi:MAG: hypothetical protein MI920_36960 [Kiloniellales bacterium]|nr:hypothetical protein [Kiloniellales bacterium]
MKLRHSLMALAGVAAVALIAGPAYAQTVTSTVSLNKTYDEDVDVEVDNTVDVDIAKDIDVSKDMDYNGVVNITGNINVSEAALSTVDNKQIIDDNFVDVTGDDATLSNIVLFAGGAVGAVGGNIGLNAASGDNIIQENVAVLSAIGSLAAAGSADAEVFKVQKSINNSFTGDSDAEVFNNTQVTGAVLAAAVGNIGLNAATGAFNEQKNALAIAAVTGEATLSEATAAILQETTFNSTSHNDTANEVKLIDDVLLAAGGNIGVNLAAGTNLLQNNTLAISSVTP